MCQTGLLSVLGLLYIGIEMVKTYKDCYNFAKYVIKYFIFSFLALLKSSFLTDKREQPNHNLCATSKLRVFT